MPTSSSFWEVDSVKNLIFHFHMIKTLLQSCSKQYFQLQSCLSKCLEGNREHIFKTDPKLSFTMIPAHPSYGAMLQAMYFRNG